MFERAPNGYFVRDLVVFNQPGAVDRWPRVFLRGT